MIKKLFPGVITLTAALPVAAIFVPTICDPAQEEPKPKPKIETLQPQAKSMERLSNLRAAMLLTLAN